MAVASAKAASAQKRKGADDSYKDFAKRTCFPLLLGDVSETFLASLLNDHL